MWAQVANGKVLRVVSTLPEVFENMTGFHLADADTVRSKGFLPFRETRNALPTEYHYYGNAVQTINVNEVISSYPVLESPIADIKAKLIDFAKNKRANMLNSGFTDTDGTIYYADSGSLADMLAVISSKTSPINWKAANKWITLTTSQLQIVLNKVNYFIQECYSAEYRFVQQINQISTATQAISVNKNFSWPA